MLVVALFVVIVVSHGKYTHFVVDVEERNVLTYSLSLLSLSLF